jgi:Tfp pilus assembly protein PilO
MADESFEQQIAKMEKRLPPLRIEHEQLKRIFESEQTQIVRLEHMHAEEEQLQREIAAMKSGHFPGAPPQEDGEEDCGL